MLFRIIPDNAKSIIIADSSTIGKIGLRAVIGGINGFEVVSEVETSDELLDSVKSISPELVIIDFLSEGFDIDVLVKIKREFTRTKILAVTPMQSSQTFVHAMKAGVDSYIKKSCDLEEITDAIIKTEWFELSAERFLKRLKKHQLKLMI